MVPPQFEHVEGNNIYCRECHATFRVRQTAGDPGCVIDCDLPANSRYDVLIEPDTPGANPRHFWQVLKACELSLQRGRVWCHSLGETAHTRLLDRRREEGPLGERLYYFEPREVSRTLVWRQWYTFHRRHHERDSAGAPSEYEYFYHTADLSGSLNRLELTEQVLRQRGCKTGYYTRDQVVQTFYGLWVPRCIPKVGASPVRRRAP